jgi:hypothetical protein
MLEHVTLALQAVIANTDSIRNNLRWKMNRVFVRSTLPTHGTYGWPIPWSCPLVYGNAVWSSISLKRSAHAKHKMATKCCSVIESPVKTIVRFRSASAASAHDMPPEGQSGWISPSFSEQQRKLSFSRAD